MIQYQRLLLCGMVGFGVCVHRLSPYLWPGRVGIKRWQKPLPPANTGHPGWLLPLTPTYPTWYPHQDIHKVVHNPSSQHGPSFPPCLARTHTRVSPLTNLPNQSYPQEAFPTIVFAHKLPHQGIHSVDSTPDYPIWGTHTKVLIPGYPDISKHTRVSIILDSIPMYLKIPT